MAKNAYVDLTDDSVDLVDYSAPIDRNQVPAANRVLPSNINPTPINPRINGYMANGSANLQPQMNPQYINAPEPVPRYVNQYKAPMKPPFVALRGPNIPNAQNLPYHQNPPYHANLPKGPNVMIAGQPETVNHGLNTGRLIPQNLIGQGVDALQEHLKKAKAFQQMYQKPGDQKYYPPGQLTAELFIVLFYFIFIFLTVLFYFILILIFSMIFTVLLPGISYDTVHNIIQSI